MTPGMCGTHVGAGYSDEQRQFLLAMQALKTRLGRHPTDAEVLREAQRLGYRRAEKVKAREALRRVRGL